MAFRSPTLAASQKTALAGRRPAPRPKRATPGPRCLATFPSWYVLCQTMQHPRVRLGEHCQCELCTMTQTMLPAAMIRIGTPSLFCPGRLEKVQVIEALQGVLHNEGISARSREPNVST